MDKQARPKLKVRRQQVRRRRHQVAWITPGGGTANFECWVEDLAQYYALAVTEKKGTKGTFKHGGPDGVS